MYKTPNWLKFNNDFRKHKVTMVIKADAEICPLMFSNVKAQAARSGLEITNYTNRDMSRSERELVLDLYGTKIRYLRFFMPIERQGFLNDVKIKIKKWIYNINRKIK